jgi:pentatricopeptide repeat protein
VTVLMLPLYLLVTPWPPHPMRDPHLHEELKRLGRSGRLVDAEVLFDAMPSRDEVAYTILLTGHAAAADFHGAMALFACLRGSFVVSSVFVATTLAAVSRMGSHDVASLTTLIASYVQTGHLEEAIEKFVRMLHDEASNAASPNEYTFSAVIAASANFSSVRLGVQLHAQPAQRGFAQARSVANSLVKLYARDGLLSAADAVFRESIIKDVVSWSAIISGYAQEGLAKEAFTLFAEMQHHSICPRPNEFTLASPLSTCASMAALDAGRQLHTLAVAAGLEHHAMVKSALVDMYGKSGSMSDVDVVATDRTNLL